jgi:adenylate cyclase
MSYQLPSSIKNRAYILVNLIVSLAATGLLLSSGLIRYWDKVLYDLCINNRVHKGVLKGQENNKPDIATIELNDESIIDLGDWLDTRQAFKELFEVLKVTNSNAVLDFQFGYEKSQDRDFVNAIKEHGIKDRYSVVGAVALEGMQNKPYKELDEEQQSSLKNHTWKIKVNKKGKVPVAESFLLPFPTLMDALKPYGIGFMNMEPDNDGIYRRVPLLYEWKGEYLPSLPLAAAVKQLGIPIDSIELKAGKYIELPVSTEETILIPIDEKGQMLIPYTYNYDDDEGRIPLKDVVNANNNDDYSSEDIRKGLINHIALVAETSTNHNDSGATSFDKLYPLSGIHAEVLNGILYGYDKKAFIGWAPLWYKVIILIFLLAVAFLCINIRKDAPFHLGFLGELLAISGVTFFLWHIAAISPWFAFPVTMLFFLWLSAFLHRLFIRYREQLLLHNALTRYFPHALADRIMRERKTELVPAYKELTILFSDISGFTKWSSDKSPDNVHNFLSDYLESMAEILFSYGGTVDKFMGDGILAFFGDPFEMSDHCERCVKAAIAMQEKVRFLAKKWKPVVDIDLKVRIGINTGKVIVGNLGNKTRIEYTVIGAAVNLAQRMESNAPIGGILVTADAREKVNDRFTFSEKRDVTVKGYGETIEAYVVDIGNIDQ